MTVPALNALLPALARAGAYEAVGAVLRQRDDIPADVVITTLHTLAERGAAGDAAADTVVASHLPTLDGGTATMFTSGAVVLSPAVQRVLASSRRVSTLRALAQRADLDAELAAELAHHRVDAVAACAAYAAITDATDRIRSADTAPLPILLRWCRDDRAFAESELVFGSTTVDRLDAHGIGIDQYLPALPAGPWKRWLHELLATTTNLPSWQRHAVAAWFRTAEVDDETAGVVVRLWANAAPFELGPYVEHRCIAPASHTELDKSSTYQLLVMRDGLTLPAYQWRDRATIEAALTHDRTAALVYASDFFDGVRLADAVERSCRSRNRELLSALAVNRHLTPRDAAAIAHCADDQIAVSLRAAPLTAHDRSALLHRTPRLVHLLCDTREITGTGVPWLEAWFTRDVAAAYFHTVCGGASDTFEAGAVSRFAGVVVAEHPDLHDIVITTLRPWHPLDASVADVIARRIGDFDADQAAVFAGLIGHWSGTFAQLDHVARKL